MNGVKKLEALKLIKQDDDYWITTEEGDDLVKENQESFKEILKQFQDNLHNY